MEALVKAYGGWIESSSVNGANYYDTSRGYSRNRSASYSLRIPSNRFSELMGNLSDLGNIPYSHTYTENVTAQYYDVQARVTALSTQEQRLLEMMELAETVEDIIILEDRLTEIRYQIESLQSSLNNWDRQVSYSTVDISLREETDTDTVQNPELSLGERMLTGLRAGLASLGAFLSDMAVFLAAALPFLLIIVLAVIIIAVIRRRKIRGKGKEEYLAQQDASDQTSGS